MLDVGTVEAFALHDVGFLPDDLLGRANRQREAEDVCFARELEPFVIHFADAVAGAEDEVDEIRLLVHLGQPVGEGHFHRVAGSAESFDGALNVLRTKEHIEVLGIAPDIGVRTHRIGTADEEGDGCRTQDVNGGTVEIVSASGGW